jgi:hypothetical protein
MTIRMAIALIPSNASTYFSDKKSSRDLKGTGEQARIVYTLDKGDAMKTDDVTR